MRNHHYNIYPDININAKAVVSLTKEQLRRVDDAFVELFQYSFEYQENNYQRKNVGNPAATNKNQNDRGMEITSDKADDPLKNIDDNTMVKRHFQVPPKWLYKLMGNSTKHSIQVWNQLSKEQQLLFSSNKSMRAIVTKQKRCFQYQSHVHVAVKRQSLRPIGHYRSDPNSTISNNSAQNKLYAEMASTNRTTAQSHMQPPFSVASVGTNINTNLRPGGMDNLLASIKDEQNKSTIIKRTHDNWEYYKDSTQSRDAIEQYSTTNQAFIPKQEFKHRVQLRQFDLTKRNK